MADEDPESWFTYQIRRDTRKENPSVLRLTGRRNEMVTRREVHTCIESFKFSVARLKEGIKLWTDGKATTFESYMDYTNAADTAADKIE